MTVLFLILKLYLLTDSVFCNGMTYYDNFNSGDQIYGPDYAMTDYLVLANDPVSNLPPAFTICTSLFLRYMTTEQTFMQMDKANGWRWFIITIDYLRGRSWADYIESFKPKESM